MWTDEIFINALSDALIQRTRPALYDQLDVVTTATDQRLKVESTAAICKWVASADLEDSDSELQDESKDSISGTIDRLRLQLYDDRQPPPCADLCAMCMKVIAETVVVCEEGDALVAENSALKAKNLKMKIQKALHEKSVMEAVSNIT
ncbi:hypothetical protein B0H14DRAFT_2603873 [Mycena olivaceomarginata]|nr:hypothetical protein B0H14DRAFT_2603873 [Mycena olivaceomarginata]